MSLQQLTPLLADGQYAKCRKCGKLKPKTHFVKNHNNKLPKKKGLCKECRNIWAKERERITHASTKAYRKWRRQLIDLLGGKCRYCGCDNYEALEINHKFGGGSEIKRRIGKNGLRSIYREIALRKREMPNDLECTCRVCNSLYYMRTKGITGHKVLWQPFV